MSVYKDARSDNYTIEFQIGGERYKKTHEGVTSQRDAENLERSLKIEMKDRHRSAKDQRGKPISIDEAIDRYCIAHKATPSASNNDFFGRTAKEFLAGYARKDGSHLTLLYELCDADVSEFVRWRSAQPKWGDDKFETIANAAINHSTVKFIRRVSLYAERAHGVVFNKKPIWRDHLLPEKSRRTRRLQDHEHKGVLNFIDHDYAALMQFSLVSGLRKTASLLTWSNVDFVTKTFKYANKGYDKKRGDELKKKSMTPAMEALLRSRIGHDPVYVFTYVKKQRPYKGQRFPITITGLDSRWKRVLKALNIEDCHWHDLRRTFASHLYKITKDLALVQDALNHADPATTRLYVVVDDDDMVSAMAKAEERFTANFTPTLAIEHKPRLIEDKREAG